MKEDNKKNRKRIMEEETRESPTSKGYDFKSKNKEVEELMVEKKKQEGKELKAKNIKRFKIFGTALLVYLILFSSFMVFSLHKLNNRDINGVSSGNSLISEKPKRVILNTATENDITLDVHEVNRDEGAVKVVYTLTNNSKYEIYPLIESTILSDKEGTDYQGFLDYATLKTTNLKPGEYYEGFIAFAAMVEGAENPSQENSSSKRVEEFKETELDFIFSYLNKNDMHQIKMNFKG